MDNKYVCPKCGGQLEYYVITEGVRGHKINKNGMLSKQTLRSFGVPTDIYFLRCDKYNCQFKYYLTNQNLNYEIHEDLDSWYKQYGKIIE